MGYNSVPEFQFPDLVGSYAKGKALKESFADAEEDRAYKRESRGQQKELYEYGKSQRPKQEQMDQITMDVGKLDLAQKRLTHASTLLQGVTDATSFNSALEQYEAANGPTGMNKFKPKTPPEVIRNFVQSLTPGLREEQTKLNYLKQQNEYTTQRDTRQNEYELSKMGKQNEYNIKEIEANRKNRNQPELVELWDRIKTLPEGDPERESLMQYTDNYSENRYKPGSSSSRSFAPGGMSEAELSKLENDLRQEYSETMLDESGKPVSGAPSVDVYVKNKMRERIEASGKIRGSLGLPGAEVPFSSNAVGGSGGVGYTNPAPFPSPSPTTPPMSSVPSPGEMQEFAQLESTPDNEAGFVYAEYERWDPDKQARFLDRLEKSGKVNLAKKIMDFENREANQPKGLGFMAERKAGQGWNAKAMVKDFKEMYGSK